ncbi:hypothetical protein ABZ863_34665 [Saccharomonospora sp. NPDC046836]|uniref:hypothetical protein n=1 Tax=Saccharomonospora sp. NPDC046836 TaxID=3156921 RepID=UPI0033DBC3A1
MTTELPLTSGYLPCIHIAQSDLTSHFSTPDGSAVSAASEIVEANEKRAAEAVQGYQLPTEFPNGDAIARVPGFMQIARKVMEKDGAHATIACLFAGTTLVSTLGMRFDDQRTKRLAFESLAQLVERKRADGVLVISELWMGVQTEIEKKLNTILLPARYHIGKKEGLVVYAVTRDGRRSEQQCFVERGANGETTCSDPVEGDPGALNIMVPVFRTWKEMESRGI